ncbi:HNH endonuclease [Streptomyces bauhiniae]|uniref:HNH endonuclease n=1 Tax=Streptomyces bauhiniae TaxID=2340725 RepID=A0A7K3QRH9_9ACTN|nr:HNH endonuclease [Streptomyces bauhiniae]
MIEPFDRLTVFERDSWTCYLCGHLTNPDASPFDPSSPTVDHIHPLSKGGHHTLANAGTACLGCNSSKQASIITAA